MTDLLCQTKTEDALAKSYISKNKFLLSNLGINVGIGLNSTEVDYSKRFVGITPTINYGMINNLTAGIGAGFLSYNGGTLFPVFLQLKLLHPIRNIFPFINGDAGILIDPSENGKGNRFFLNPSTGVSYKINNRFATDLSVGLFMQKIKDGGHDSFINIRFGFNYFLYVKAD
jgi:hypothetical protein